MGKRYSAKQSLFAFGAHQTNYTTEVAADDDPKNYRLIEKNGYDKASFDSPNVNNAGESTGLALPNKTSKDRDATAFSAQEQLTYQLLGLRANDAFGVTATPEVVSVGAVWKHLFSLLDIFVSPTLPSRPLASKVGEPASSGNVIYDARFPSMVYNRFSVTDQTDKPNLVLTSDWLGSGRLAEPSGIQFYGAGRHVTGTDAADLTENPINKKARTATLYPQKDFGGTAITTECLFQGFTVEIQENLVLNYDCNLFQDSNPAKGAVAGGADSTGQGVALDITLIADSDVVQALNVNETLKAGDELSLKIVYTGSVITGIYTHKATFGLARFVIASVDYPELEGGTQGIHIVTEPLGVGNSMPFWLELITDVADFNTYIGA